MHELTSIIRYCLMTLLLCRTLLHNSRRAVSRAVRRELHRELTYRSPAISLTIDTFFGNTTARNRDSL
jgi:hypothetical protein